MWPMFDTVAANLGVSFEYLVIIIAFCGGLIFYAKDFKIGVVVNFVIFTLLFMWFYGDGLNYVPAIIIMFMHLVVLAFTLYVTSNKANAPGGVV